MARFPLNGEVRYGTAVTLQGVAQYWEMQPEIRERLRTSKRLFVSAADPNNLDPPLHVKDAACNELVLAPLMKALSACRRSDASLQLFKISQIERQSL